ncbi:MAG: replication initiation protein [Cetobacterium sp.]
MRDKEIAHHNSIAKGKLEDFELRELKLFLALMSDIEKDKILYEYPHLKIKQFINMGDQSYTIFNKVIKKLQKRVLVINNEDEEFRYSIFSLLYFNNKTKTITVEYSHRFFPLISEFQNNFCKYKLKNLENLTSKYSVIFYILCKANQFKKEFVLSNSDIELKIGKKMKSNDLDRRVLDPVVSEINTHTDINIEIKKEYAHKIGRGRTSLTGYRFVVSKKILEITNELKVAINKAKKNIYIQKSMVLNYESLQLLLSDIPEKKLILGLNFAYSKINKEFTKLEYLKKVILTSSENEIKSVTKQSIKETNIDELIENHKDIIEQKLNIKKTVNTIISEDLEAKIIEYLINVENINQSFLINLKRKSNTIYQNLLKSNIHKIKI